MELLKLLHDPGREYSPIPFWFLNGDLTHREIRAQLTDFRAHGVYGVVLHPRILGRNAGDMFPWTRGFAELFAAALFRGEENQDTRLYRKMLLERENEVYYGALSAWCEAHGVALMGHPDRSDDIERERFFHIPGQDLVYRFVVPERGGLSGEHSTMAKCSADAARLMGRRRNSNECFGACNRDDNPWYLTGGDIKWFLDWLAVRDVNLFIPHAFYYSIAGKRRAERPPDVGPHSIWWPHYGQWSLYMRRLSCLMTDADLYTDVAVLCRSRELVPERTAPLFRRQIGFQYLPESVWPECREENGALFCRGRRYGAVLGPGDMFPGVPHDVSAIEPDCRCDPPQPDLRAARFMRSGTQYWLLVNEGERGMSKRFSRSPQTNPWEAMTYGPGKPYPPRRL